MFVVIATDREDNIQAVFGPFPDRASARKDALKRSEALADEFFALVDSQDADWLCVVNDEEEVLASHQVQPITKS